MTAEEIRKGLLEMHLGHLFGMGLITGCYRGFVIKRLFCLTCMKFLKLCWRLRLIR